MIDGNIPVKELAKTLKDGFFETDAPLATELMYKIEPQTLIDIADAVRSIGGTQGEIAVRDLEIKIANLLVQLKMPNIEIKNVSLVYDDESISKSQQLKEPIVRVVEVIENVLEEEYLASLEQPSIAIVEVKEAGEEWNPTLSELKKPEISIVEVSKADETHPTIPIMVLSRPYIKIAEIRGETGEEIKPILVALDPPEIAIVEANKDQEQPLPSATPLKQPNIQLFESRLDVEIQEKPIIKPLKDPNIKIVDFKFEEQAPEYTVQTLQAPEIFVAEREIIVAEKPSYTVKNLKQPHILVDILLREFADIITPKIPSIKNPIIEIVGASSETPLDPEYTSTSINTPNIHIEEVGKADEQEPPRPPTNISEPEIDIAWIVDLEEEESELYEQTLTEPQIKISDVIVSIKDEETKINQLKVPEIEIYLVHIDDSTAILGKAILGKAILGKR